MLVTIPALLVRTEFCEKFVEVGGLKVLKDLMVTFYDNDVRDAPPRFSFFFHLRNFQKLSRHCFKLLKSLAGNDECKAKIIGCGLAPVITSTLSRHKVTNKNLCCRCGNVVLGSFFSFQASKPTASIGLWCVSALTLRSPDNSKAMFESGIAEVIVGCMKLHPNDASVQVDPRISERSSLANTTRLFCRKTAAGR